MRKIVSQCQRFSNSGGRDAMLEGARMIPGNRCKYTIFIDNDLIVSEWGVRNMFCFQGGAFQECGTQSTCPPLFTNLYIKCPFLDYIAAFLHARVPPESMFPQTVECSYALAHR